MDVSSTEMSQQSVDSMSVAPPMFQVDERVYCRDLGAKTNTANASLKRGRESTNEAQYYEAIIRKIRLDNHRSGTNAKNGPDNAENDTQWSFLVHYSGWNSRWDRWLSTEDILKDTQENRDMVLSLQKADTDNTPANANASVLTTNNGVAKKRSRLSKSSNLPSNAPSNNSNMNATNTSALLYSDYCELPFTLKTVLVDEYELLTAHSNNALTAPTETSAPQRLVHHLPAYVTIRKVLNHFAKTKIKEYRAAAAARVDATSASAAAAAAGTTTLQPPTANDANAVATTTPEIITSFIEGLAQLFREALPVCLLYPEERPQYDAILTDGNIGASRKMDITELYGCEYLLRLYVRLPILLQVGAAGATTPHHPKTAWSFTPTIVGPLLTDLIVLMQKNRATLFPKTISHRPDGGHSTDTAHLVQGGTVTSNYRVLRDEEWLDWERRLHRRETCENGTRWNDTPVATAESSPHSPIVKMDTL